MVNKKTLVMFCSGFLRKNDNEKSDEFKIFYSGFSIKNDNEKNKKMMSSKNILK